MRKKIAVLIVVLVFVVGGGVLAHGHLSAVSVDVWEVREETVGQLVTGTGHLAGEEEREIVARHSMVVEKLAVDVGDRVTAGDLLARGDAENIELQKRNLAAERDILRDELAGAEESLPAQLRGAESGLAAARESLRDAQEDAATLRGLYESGAVAQRDWREAELLVSAREAEVKGAEAKVQEIKREKRQMVAGRRRVDSLDEQIDSLRKKIAEHEITAGADMVVGARRVEEGDVVAAGAPLFLLHTETMLVEMDVLAGDARDIVAGQPAVISGDAVGDVQWHAEVRKVYPRAVERVSELGVRQRRVPVELVLEAMPESAGPGYPVDVEIIVAEETGLALDRDAVFQLDRADHVFVVRDEVARLREVTVGLEGDELAIVEDGLSAGDIVVVNPPAELDDGARVQIER